MLVLNNTKYCIEECDSNLIKIPNNEAFDTLKKHFVHGDCKKIEANEFCLKYLVALSAIFNVEFAIYKQNNQMFVKKGEEVNSREIASHVLIPNDAICLIHTHPTFRSISENFTNDIKACNQFENEAVIDYSYNIIVYNNEQVFNKKDNDGFYLSLDFDSERWPLFLNKDLGERIICKI